jgi:hypothetical protein
LNSPSWLVSCSPEMKSTAKSGWSLAKHLANSGPSIHGILMSVTSTCTGKQKRNRARPWLILLCNSRKDIGAYSCFFGKHTGQQFSQ